ncbi:MAG: bifunctional folylpolyglutamate synthase/dihydrofolate synthase [Butyrivibrio sp.]
MKDIIEYIYNIPKFSRKCSLDNTLEMLKRLGNPAFDRKVVHVAGTNGKGSVCTYLDNILRAAGHTTGVFTSPHLVKMNERIRINGADISDEEFTEAFTVVHTVAEEMVRDGYAHPSFFEFLFGMGMYEFGKSNAEYVILETGLGGRLDATNSFPFPVLSVITSVSLDHTDILGNTYTEIASEKAGIIKKNIPVLFADKREDVTKVILDKAGTTDSPVYSVSRENIMDLVKRDKYIDFSLNNGYYDNERFSVRSHGLYQAENGALAVTAANILGIRNPDIIRKGLLSAEWTGRMQEIDRNMILDGAHNEDGIAQFLESVKEDDFEGDRYLMFSAVADKHYEEMIKAVCESGLFKGFIIVPISDPRGLDLDTMEAAFKKYSSGEIIVMKNLSQGIFQACMLRDRGNIIYMAGSLYLAGEIMTSRE